MLGIEEGAELTYTRDENITCTIVANNQVLYNEKIYSLSALSAELLNSKYGVQGPLYWLYHGKTLTELRSELERQQEEE
ncbi:MAG: hypothetical protein ACRCWI_01445 [Brevinema sp.]